MRDSPGGRPFLVPLSVRRPLESLKPWQNEFAEGSGSADEQTATDSTRRTSDPASFAAAARLTENERGILSTLLVQQRSYGGNAELVRRGQPATRAFILHSGWACAHRSLPSGARQVLSVYVPGDLIGYPAPQLPRDEAMVCGHTISALTPAEVSEIGLDRLSGALEIAPGLARAMLWDTTRANAILEERLMSLGRRSARERTAHFFLELSVRLSCGTHEVANGFACPLSQYVVADALGLSAEHLNRVLKQLRIAGLLQVRNGWVEITDREGLMRLSDFDGGYLSPPVAP